MDRIELLYVEREIKERGIVGRHFQKAAYRRCCHTLKFNRLMLTLSLEQERFHLTYLYPEVAVGDKLSRKLKAELSNWKVRDFGLVKGDRVVRVDFYEKALVVDLVKGNVGIEVEGEMVWSLHEKWAQPRELSFDPSLPAGRMLGKALGGKYVQDLLEILSAEPSEAVAPEEAERALGEFLGKARPYWRGEEYRLSLKPLEGWREAETLSEAVDRALTKPLADERALERWRRSVESVRKSIEERRAKAKELREKGDAVYANYDKVEEIIALARAGKWEELAKKYKVLGVDKAKKWVEVEL